jgi:hypothetical protein
LNRTPIAAIALAGCFGAGPVPAEPSDATIVFVAPTPDANNVCTTSTYVTSLAFGSNSGFAALYGYQPNNNDNCNSGTTPTVPVDILAFPLDGTSPEGHVVAMAGMSNMQILPPLLTSGPSGVIAFFNTPGQPIGSPNAVSPGGSIQMLQSGGGYIIGASSLAFATTNAFMGTSDPMNPQYPCCGGNNGNPQSPPASVVPFQLGGSGTIQLGTPAGEPLAFGELPSAIASNSASTFFVATGSGSFAIDQLATGTTSTLTSMPAANGFRPVGLVADDAHVAWALAQDAQTTPLMPGCQIGYANVGGSGGSNALFGGQDISCMGLAIDPQAVYFAIVESVTPADCGGCQPVLHGLGIGRVDFNGMFSSIAFDIANASSGPRRVFTTPDDPMDIFVLDPMVVVKIPKMAFAGRQDISP